MKIYLFLYRIIFLKNIVLLVSTRVVYLIQDIVLGMNHLTIMLKNIFLRGFRLHNLKRIASIKVKYCFKEFKSLEKD